MQKEFSLVGRDTLFHEFKTIIEICDAIMEVNSSSKYCHWKTKMYTQ
jgi:hypothetical protein